MDLSLSFFLEFSLTFLLSADSKSFVDKLFEEFDRLFSKAVS